MATASPDDTTTPAAPDSQVAALEGRIEQLQTAIAAQGDSTGQLTTMIGQLQHQLQQMAPAQPEPSSQPAAPNEEFNKLYQDIPGYIRQVALEANREVLGPHLAQQAQQTRDAMLAQAQAGVDAEYGEGTWAEHFQKDVATTIKDLPLEMQSSRAHLEAAISAVLGRQYLNPEGAEKLESRRSKARKAKEDAMNMLPNGRPRPARPDQPTDQERDFLGRLGRSGIDMDAARYMAVKNMSGGTLDDWEAATKTPAGKGK